LYFVAHRLLERSLTSDRSASSSLGTASRGERVATMACFNAAKFGSSFTLG
jgi:hypothetical protein